MLSASLKFLIFQIQSKFITNIVSSLSRLDNKRVGIITTEGRALGFVFLSDLNLKVSHLQKAINFQVHKFHLHTGYVLLPFIFDISFSFLKT